VGIDILEEIGFERDSYVPYKPPTLPTGYLKRLELARCLALKPEVIICDEVFSGLSMSEIASMVPLIERLQMDGITLIMIEHRLRELFQVANRVMVLNFGEKLVEGDRRGGHGRPPGQGSLLWIRGGRGGDEPCLRPRDLMVFYENMLALNNVSIRCEKNQIVGVFGANSAGKSTLMYALSGIMLDIRKKEEMAGGERITLAGSIVPGTGTSPVKPSRRARWASFCARNAAGSSRKARCWKT
jgi:ABC-type branched-subunit amino acid transport system ATPase component